MADINQVITLGIGVPADIPHFVLYGLTPAPQTTAVGLALTTADGVTLALTTDKGAGGLALSTERSDD